MPAPILATVLSGLMLSWSVIALAQTDRPNTETDAKLAASLALDLNKLEDDSTGCRAFLVVDSGFDAPLDRFALDLVLFDEAGVVLRRVLLDMAPLRPRKETVMAFHLDDGPCGRISRVLVNDIPACRFEGGSPADCLDLLTVTSRAGVPLDR